MLNLDILTTAIENNDAAEIANIIRKYNLKVVDGKITAPKSVLSGYVDYWDKAQHIKKINLNSVYGILLNNGCRFFDKRLGQSITLTGRQIVKHMSATVNEIITGEYDHIGQSIIYGDSVFGDSMIHINDGTIIPIEQLYNRFSYVVIQDGGKEHAIPRGELNKNGEPIKILGYNSYEDEIVFGRMAYIMRHKTSKEKWKISTVDGKYVVVTGDHSLIIDRDGFTLELKPSEILKDDLLICLPDDLSTNMIDTCRDIARVECLGTFDDEYVYDISMENQDPFFFANGILVHNTDSVYFSAYPILKDDIDAGKIDWSKDAIIKLYDQIGELVNESFPSFMKKAFHCPEHMGRVIKAGREIIGSKALFMTKYRYAVLFYDKEGKRYDVDGKQGKVKAMGLDLKRADTPKVMQDFLSIVLEKVLTGVDKEIILEDIVDFRLQFKERPGWEKGTPKRVNGIGKFSRKEEELGKANIPGHVRAGINWNMLKKLNGDNYSMTITDGFKVIVCKLKPNPMGLTSVAYPIDELRLPQWFKELPFDHDAMESAIIDKKLQNLIGVLEWDLSSTTRSNLFEQLFDFT